MPIAHIARFLLNRVGNRVTEVQDASEPALALVLPHNIRLDLARARNHMHRRRGFEGEHVRAVLRKPRKEIGIADDAVLDDLAEPRRNLALRQTAQEIQLHKDRIRLVEGADEILSERVVDSDLASDA